VCTPENVVENIDNFLKRRLQSLDKKQNRAKVSSLIEDETLVSIK